jgi:hypothetical protein
MAISINQRQKLAKMKAVKIINKQRIGEMAANIES